MKEGLAALTKLVKVVMSYRPDRAKKPKPLRRKPPRKTVTQRGE
jgi:hypothetical protein